ncbi:MAG: tRNA-uridine aminocarboxypropyltransferase [Rhodoferax sp.]|uniref:tRNA-uridine aminocarboxypropyltransferase n=1 Tax=Rhodoferax sp. TaxID=50421 RepID=UPI002ACDF7F6|nr:tRNA-uridine aminocarboxypropyltransferase [Rhodoferax sp.]MDZ7890522.1 tRNA-uridine aminocarboxypropyltransferase [Rhodoferax sp.]
MSRPTCPHCLRPQATCLCHLVVPTASACELLILQHPLEVRHAKNSARLLHLSVPGSRIVVGEAFDEVALQALLPGPRTTVLLYPPTQYEGHAAADLLEPKQLQHPETLRLVVLDATWRKSRKMLHLNPGLQRLPRLALSDVPAGRYSIRKAHAPGQLSTLEATCAALAQLERNAERWQPLLAAFDDFVARQQTWAAR